MKVVVAGLVVLVLVLWVVLVVAKEQVPALEGRARGWDLEMVVDHLDSVTVKQECF